MNAVLTRSRSICTQTVMCFSQFVVLLLLLLFALSGFRSKARLPVVTYLHGPTGAVLTRSAQPMVGLGQKNCAADAKLLNLYRCKGKALEAK